MVRPQSLGRITWLLLVAASLEARAQGPRDACVAHHALIVTAAALCSAELAPSAAPVPVASRLRCDPDHVGSLATPLIPEGRYDPVARRVYFVWDAAGPPRTPPEALMDARLRSFRDEVSRELARVLGSEAWSSILSLSRIAPDLGDAHVPFEIRDDGVVVLSPLERPLTDIRGALERPWHPLRRSASARALFAAGRHHASEDLSLQSVSLRASSGGVASRLSNGSATRDAPETAGPSARLLPSKTRWRPRLDASLTGLVGGCRDERPSPSTHPRAEPAVRDAGLIRTGESKQLRNLW